MPRPSASQVPRRLLGLLALLTCVLAATACGGGEGGGGEEPSPEADQAAVERATISYIEESTSDEDDPENASALDVTVVSVSGDEAESKARSSATGNRYEVALTRAGESWEGRTLTTDRPTESSSGGEDAPSNDNPAEGPGQKASTEGVEKQIKARLLDPVGIGGRAQCPPQIAIREGNNFDCEIVGGKRDGTVQVVQKDDEGNLSFKVNLEAN